MTIAVVGTGSAGRRHLANLRALGREVVAVSATRGRGTVGLDAGEVDCLPTIDEAIALGLEAVVVANATSAHEAATAAALDAGLDVYLEKPATPTAASAAALATRARGAGAVVAVGHQLRFHPVLDALRAVVAGGELGRLLVVRADWVEHLADYHPDEDYRTGYAARRELGGGVLLTQIHLPDLLHHLVGPFRSVRAVGGQLTHLELDVDDSVTFLATAADDLAVTGHLDYVGRPKRSILELRGTAGWATADLVAGTLAVQRSDPLGPVDVQDHPIERNDLFVATMADFLDACAQRRAPRCSLDDAVAVLELTDAIRASMAGGGDVAVGRA